VPTSGFTIEETVWWLASTTSRSVDAASCACTQANCRLPIDPSYSPLGFTVSSTTNRSGPWSKVQ